MPPVRFIHASDLHLDTSFSGAGLPPRVGHRKREAIRAALRRILEDARSDPVDFVLIAGDLFEHERVTPDTVEFLKQQFAGLAPIPVYIAPGNHDPCLRGSPYCEERWPENTFVFREERFASVEPRGADYRITGFGYNRTQYRERLFGGLQPLPADRINIVVAHGSDVRRVPWGKTAHGPFTIEEVAGKNVRYCALGHYHQQREVENPCDGTAVWYSGIPEGRGWDEEGEGGYLRVEIDAARVQVRPRLCCRYPLRTIEVDCEGLTTREQVIDAILKHRGSALDPSAIVRIRLSGAIDPRLGISLPEMEQRLAGEALHIAWEDLTEPALDFESIARDSTLAGLFARELNARLEKAEEQERALLVRARRYGIQALLGREVRLR